MIGIPLIPMTMSSILSSAFHAGKSARTSVIKIPWPVEETLVSLYCMPTIGLAIFPKFLIEFNVLPRNSLLIGNTNAIPSHSVMAVVMLNTLPLISSNGHPLLPGLIMASV